MSDHQHMHRTRPDIVQGRDRSPDVRRYEVIEVTHVIGEGCCHDDLVREVRSLYTIDGELLTVIDPAPSSQRETP